MSAIHAPMFSLAQTNWQQKFGPAYLDVFRDYTWDGTKYYASGQYPTLSLKAGTCSSSVTKWRFTFEVGTISSGSLPSPWCLNPITYNQLAYGIPGFSPTSGGSYIATLETPPIGSWKTGLVEEVFATDKAVSSAVVSYIYVTNFEVYIP